jgi:hypothetical protein
VVQTTHLRPENEALAIARGSKNANAYENRVAPAPERNVASWPTHCCGQGCFNSSRGVRRLKEDSHVGSVSCTRRMASRFGADRFTSWQGMRPGSVVATRRRSAGPRVNWQVADDARWWLGPTDSEWPLQCRNHGSELLTMRGACQRHCPTAHGRKNSIMISSSSLPSIVTCARSRPHSTKPSRW